MTVFINLNYHNHPDWTNDTGFFGLLRENLLLFSPTKLGDNGSLMVMNTSFIVCFPTTFTRVAARTIISEPPADSSVIISTTAYLHCGVSHDPNIPIIIDWLFSGDKIDYDSRYLRLSITIQHFSE